MQLINPYFCYYCSRMLRSTNVQLPGAGNRSPKNSSYLNRLTPEQISTLDAEFNKVKTLHSTDLALLAAEMAVSEEDVQVNNVFIIFVDLRIQVLNRIRIICSRL